MKRIILISLLIFLSISCTEESTGSLAPIINDYAGYYTLRLTGDMEGAATIAVNENGTVKNGMLCNLPSLALIDLRIDFIGAEEGGTLICDIKLINDSTNIKIGNLNIQLADSAEGNYNVTIPTDDGANITLNGNAIITAQN